MAKYINVFDLMLKDVVKHREDVVKLTSISVNWGGLKLNKQGVILWQHNILLAYLYYFILTGLRPKVVRMVSLGVTEGTVVALRGTLRKTVLFKFIYIINDYFFNRNFIPVSINKGVLSVSIDKLLLMPGIAANSAVFFDLEKSKLNFTFVSNCKSDVKVKVLVSSLHLFIS